MFHRNNVDMILNQHCKKENMIFQHSYDDITDVIVNVCSVNCLIFFSKWQNPLQPFCKRQYVSKEMSLYTGPK